MTQIIIAPEVNLATIQKQGVFTIMREDARLECNCPEKRGVGCGGIAIRDIPLALRSFQMLCEDYAKRYIERQRVRGFEYVDADDMLLHGPFPSYELNKNLTDINSPEWRRAMSRDKEDGLEHPERALQFVFERGDAFVDYLLLASFTLRDTYTDIEVSIGK